MADTTDPTVTSITASPDSVVAGTQTDVTVVFSESVSGFEASDVTVAAGNTANSSAGSVSSVTGSGATWRFKFSASAADTYTLSIPANAVTDAASNGNEASASGVNETVTVTAAPSDTTDPTVTSITASPDSVAAGTQTDVTVVFSESVSGFEASDVTVAAGNTANSSAGSVSSVTGSGATWRFKFSASAADTYTLSIPANAVTDAASNGNEASASGVNETVTVTAAPVADTTDPTVTSITASPDSVAAGTQTDVTVMFSESVSGFEASDVTVAAGQHGQQLGWFGEFGDGFGRDVAVQVLRVRG